MNISPRKAFELISKKGVILLDTRTLEEYQEVHIKNSILIDLTNPRFINEIKKLDKNKTYLLYCHTGGRSAYVTNLMLQLGFKNVFNIEGGILAWENSGFPVNK